MPLFVPAEILMIHGLVLMICGALAYQESGYAKGAISAIYVGNGSALVSFLLAVGIRDITLKKGDSGYKIMMICIHLAIVYPILLGTAVAWRLCLAWSNPEKAYLKPFFSIIVAMCLITTAFLVANKPKKEATTAKKEQPASPKHVEPTSAQSSATPATSESTTKRKPRKASAM